MAEASIDIRVFPNKELFSTDMAEILDGLFPFNGVIQGCTVHSVNGALSIDSGRLMVRGRLGVVTGGTIPIPTLTQEELCWLVAICDLSNTTQPFYLKLANLTELERLGISDDETPDPDFNVLNKIAASYLGHCMVNPATGLVSDWTVMAQGEPIKGYDRYCNILDRIDNTVKEYLSDYIIRKSFNTGGHSAASGTGTINYTYTIPDAEIPTGYKPFDVRCATNGGSDGWWEFYNCSCDFTDSPTNKNVNLRFQRRSGTGGTLYPWIVVTFVKDIT